MLCVLVILHAMPAADSRLGAAPGPLAALAWEPAPDPLTSFIIPAHNERRPIGCTIEALHAGRSPAVWAVGLAAGVQLASPARCAVLRLRLGIATDRSGRTLTDP